LLEKNAPRAPRKSLLSDVGLQRVRILIILTVVYRSVETVGKKVLHVIFVSEEVERINSGESFKICGKYVSNLTYEQRLCDSNCSPHIIRNDLLELRILVSSIGIIWVYRKEDEITQFVSLLLDIFYEVCTALAEDVVPQ
jgi:hypothetical protein